MFQKSSGRENKRWIRVRVSCFSVESFLSHGAGKKLGGNDLCLNEILVKKTFMHRMGVVTFVRICFCQTVPKNFVSRTLVFQKSSGRENIRCIRGRVSRFSVERFLYQRAGKNLEEPSFARMKYS